jgi:hypothetical protein
VEILVFHAGDGIRLDNGLEVAGRYRIEIEKDVGFVVPIEENTAC